MKTLLSLLILTASAGFAQAAHTATLNWVDTLNPSGTTYNVYRATGLCSGNPTFNKIATAITLKTYPDNTVPIGNSCYTVTATFQSAESNPSPTASAAVVPFAPSSITVQVATIEVHRPECEMDDLAITGEVEAGA